MLKVRYLTMKGINPVPYVTKEFSVETLRLLELPHEEAYKKIKPYLSGPITYLSAIGILDNSTFLYDYLVTLTQEQFSVELRSILRNAANINKNKIVFDAGRDIVLHDRKFEINGGDSLTILCNVALKDPELAISFPEWGKIRVMDWHRVDIFENIDVYIFYLNEKGILREYALNILNRAIHRFRVTGDQIFDIAKSIEMLKIIIPKLGIDCTDLFIDNNIGISMDVIERRMKIIIAEAIAQVCPLDYSEYITNPNLEKWWNNRIDI